MKFVKLTSLALAGMLTFAGCKYEEGPKISLRAKRDRVANEWRIEKYTYNDSDRTNQIVQVPGGNSQTPFELVLNFYRSGSYGIEVVQKSKNAGGQDVYLTNHFVDFNECCSTDYNNYLGQLPKHIQDVMSHGTWSFDRGHTKLQVKPDLSYIASEVQSQKNTIDWGIVMLREKEMKIKGRDANNTEWTLHLKRVNNEPYFY